MNAAVLRTRAAAFGVRWQAWERRRAFAGQRVVFLADLGQMMIEGRGSIGQVLAASCRRTPERALAEAYREIRQGLGGGKSLHACLRPYFDPLENMLIESIDTNARTDAQRGQGFVTAAGMIGQLGQVGGQVLSVLFELFAAVATVALVWLGIGQFAARQFEQVTPRRYWPGLSQLVVGTGEVLLSVWPLSLVLLLAATGAIAWMLPNWTGPRRRWADQRLPGFRLYRVIRATPLQMALGTFLGAHIGFDKALRKLIEHASPWEAMYLREMRTNLSGRQRRGVDIVDVGLFDWQAMVRVEVRSLGVDLDQALCHVAVQAGPRLAALMAARLNAARAAIRIGQTLALGVVALAVGLVYLAATQNIGRSF